ncbi:predicted protein [Botrytis cinerea T4]|uniref:Uncharacterized protein n=1 Tax=Botryotinia fuckeliana (strain T4) TaxID=999810 RepID=G2YCM4_BOTF4|nr:predicted protein [Botrytis cinerea T4]
MHSFTLITVDIRIPPPIKPIRVLNTAMIGRRFTSSLAFRNFRGKPLDMSVRNSPMPNISHCEEEKQNMCRSAVF